MDFFNKGKVIGNLIQEKEYRSFLCEYLDSLGRWKFIQFDPIELEDWGVTSGFTITDERLLTMLKKVSEEVKKELPKKNNKKLDKELKVIQKFAQKNIDIMEMQDTCLSHKHGVVMEMKSEYEHQNEMSMIDKILQEYPGNPQALIECEKMMNEFYEEEKMTIYEFRIAQGWVKRKREHPNEK